MESRTAVNEKEKLKNLRKKLERSSKKTRRSTDLRRYLGKKSVDDSSPSAFAGFEQLPSASLDESCHLNSDSAVIDPDFARDPYWFKHLGNHGVLASDDSIHAAILNQRKLDISNNSNVNELELSSFHPSEINKILSSSVVVDKAEIKKLLPRPALGENSRTLESPTPQDISLGPPQRKPSVFKRNLRSAGTKSSNAFDNISCEASELDDFSIAGEVRKRNTSRSSTTTTIQTDEYEKTLEIPLGKKSTFLRGRRKKSPNVSSRNVFLDVAEDSVDCEAEMGPVDISRKDASLASHVVSTRATVGGNSSALESPTPQDISLDPPQRKPSVFKRNLRSAGTKSSNAFDNISCEASELDDFSIAGEVRKRNTSRSSTTTTIQTDEYEKTLEIPLGKKSTFLRGRRNKSPDVSSRNVFLDVAEDSVDCEAEMGPVDLSRKDASLASHVVSTRATVGENSSALESPTPQDISLDPPQRKPSVFKRNLRSAGTKSSNAFDNISCEASELDDFSIAGEVRKRNTSRSSTTTTVQTEEYEKTLEIPLGKKSTFLRGRRNKSPDVSSRNVFLDVAEDSVDCEAEMGPANSSRTDASPALSLLPTRANNDVSLEKPRQILKLSVAKQAAKPSQNVFLDVSNGFTLADENLQSPDLSVKNVSLEMGKMQKKVGKRMKTDDSCSKQTSLILLKRKMDQKSQDEIHQVLKQHGNTSPTRKRRSTETSNAFKENWFLTPSNKLEKVHKASDIANLNDANDTLPLGADAESMRDSTQGDVSCFESVNFGKLSHLPNIQSLTDQVKAAPFRSGSVNSQSLVESLETNVAKKTDNISGTLLPTNSISKIRDAQPSFEGGDVGPTNECSVENDSRSSTGSGPLSNTSQASTVFYLDSNSIGSLSTEIMSDSVFLSKSSKADGKTSTARVPDKTLNKTWSENPYVEISHESHGQSATFEGTKDVETTESVPSLSLDTVFPSSSPGLFIEGASISNNLPQDDRKDPWAKTASKKLSEEQLEKMRIGLANWMQGIKSNLTATVKKPTEVAQSKPFKKPVNPAPKKSVKPKDPCPYFGDYRPPRKIRPRPYVTNKMYKFLESKLKAKFGLETRIKSEEFVSLLCALVQSTIKKKSKYHSHVLELRDNMYSLGLIKTQFDFHIFIEDFLPESFREKAIPCYGSSLCPSLNTKYLYVDLAEAKSKLYS